MTAETYELPEITVPIWTNLSDILALLEPAQVQTLLEKIETGRLDGSWFGGNFEQASVKTPADFVGCFTGWSALLAACSVKELYALAGDPDEEAWYPLERFMDNIAQGDTPRDNPYSAALHRFITGYLEFRAIRPVAPVH
jgi:hypothetical protein